MFMCVSGLEPADHVRVIFHMSSPGLKMRVYTSAPHTLGLHWS